jgi:chromosome partitioning protein
MEGDKMKTIAVSLQKGGVGKTSLAVSLAAELAKETGSALLIDADPQGSASGWIGPDALESELADVLMKQTAAKNAIIKTGFPGLSLLPTAGLGGQLKVFAEGQAAQDQFCMKRILKEAAALGFRFCIIDLSPGWGPIERAAITAADEVITPILGDSFAVDGLEIFAGNLDELRERLEPAGIKPAAYKRLILNAIDNRIKQHGETLAEITGRAAALKVYTVPVDPAFRLAQKTGLVIQALSGVKPETRAGIEALAKDIQEG